LKKQLSRKHWVLWISLVSILLLDQATKMVVEYTVPLYRSIPVIRDFFDITHIKNPGAAFGLFAGDVGLGRTLFFTIFTGAAIVLILVMFRRIDGNRVLLPLCLGMILAGAIGNLVDRFRSGYVTDFLDFYWNQYHWPAFNIADSAITGGIFLLIIEVLWGDWKGDKKKPQ
jgi:signal peptidase II